MSFAALKTSFEGKNFSSIFPPNFENFLFSTYKFGRRIAKMSQNRSKMAQNQDFAISVRFWCVCISNGQISHSSCNRKKNDLDDEYEFKSYKPLVTPNISQLFISEEIIEGSGED